MRKCDGDSCGKEGYRTQGLMLTQSDKVLAHIVDVLLLAYTVYCICLYDTVQCKKEEPQGYSKLRFWENHRLFYDVSC